MNSYPRWVINYLIPKLINLRLNGMMSWLFRSAKSLTRGPLSTSGWDDLGLDLADDEVFLSLLEDAASSAIGTEVAGALLGAFYFV